MAIRTKTFSLLGLIATVACVIAIVVSFASDRWVVSTQKEVSGFQNIGLWSVCFSKYWPPAWSLVSKYYDGCWWLLDREMDDLRHFLIPGWFQGTQILVTIALVLELLTVIVLIVNIINCFPHNRFKEQITRILSMVAAIFHAVTGILLSVAVIMFGARADNSRTWLEKPDQNYLSWSFGICVLAAFIAIIAMMFQFLEFFRLRQMQGKDGEPRIYLTNQGPVSTNYAYSRTNVSTASYTPSVRQPAYADRYYNNGSQSSLSTKPPNTTFAVSGAGEVYINGLANFDENKQQGTMSRNPVYQDKRPIDSSDSRRVINNNTANSARDASHSKNTDYEDSKKIKQPVLPEYVPKVKDVAKKPPIDSSEDSYSSDEQSVRKIKDDSDNDKSQKKSKGLKSKGRSDSEKRKKTKDDDKHSKSKSCKRSDSKKRTNKREDSHDDERSRSKRRSKKGSSASSKRRTSHSRDRSGSRDLNTSYSDSDAGSTRGRSRRRQEKEFSRKDTKRRSASEDNSKSKHRHTLKKTKPSGTHSDDNLSGSEYSSKRKTQSKSRTHSQGVKKSRSQDFSETESVKSKQSRRVGDKPKGTYSSYYEY